MTEAEAGKECGNVIGIVELGIVKIGTVEAGTVKIEEAGTAETESVTKFEFEALAGGWMVFAAGQGLVPRNTKSHYQCPSLALRYLFATPQRLVQHLAAIVS